MELSFGNLFIVYGQIMKQVRPPLATLFYNSTIQLWPLAVCCLGRSSLLRKGSGLDAQRLLTQLGVAQERSNEVCNKSIKKSSRKIEM
jgi:hypothetical protein